MFDAIIATYFDMLAQANDAQKALLKAYSKLLTKVLNLVVEEASTQDIKNAYSNALVSFADYQKTTLHNESEIQHIALLARYVGEATEKDYTAERTCNPATFANTIKTCNDGDDINMDDGDYKKYSIDTNKQFKLHATNRRMAKVLRHTVSGSGTISVKKNAKHEAHGVRYECSDLAAFMFDNPYSAAVPPFTSYDDMNFTDCEIFGWFDPIANTNQFPTKWGFLTYALKNFKFTNGEIHSIEKEHAMYHHNVQGDMLVENFHIYHCGRTAFQLVGRPGEGPPGKGNVTLRNGLIEDVCIEGGGGGSAISIHGGHDGVVTIESVIVKLGCNQDLAAPWNKNITGCLVAYLGSPSYAVKPSMNILNAHFEVGEFYPGVSPAKRANVNLSNLASLSMIGTTILNHPGTADALIIQPGSIGHITLDSLNQVTGKCRFGGKSYSTYSDMLNDIADNPQVTIV